jgi:hypothetical protein
MLLENRDTAAEELNVTEAAFSTTEVSELAKSNLDFLSALAMPLVYKFGFPPVFQAVWQWLLTETFKVRAFPQLALGLPRGFGKTTLIKIYILYCILFTQKKFILIISATATLAENILSDVMDMLNEPNIKKVFGDWRLGMEKDTQSLKKFGFRNRNITLAALGAGTSLRGLNIKNERPDIMIFEDIQTREQADSQIQSENLEKWMVGTAMKAKSPTGCTFIFVANMYPTKWSILRKLKGNDTWIKFIAGGILADGTSLWEDLQPIAQLEKEFQNDLAMGRPEIFYAEVLNDENASSNNLIDLSLLPSLPYDESEGEPRPPAGGRFIIIDPSGNKANSDATAIGYFEVHDARPVLISCIHEKLSPGDTIREALRLGLENDCRLICTESVAYQASLNYWFQVICQQQGIYGFEFVELYPGGWSKNSRILAMLKSYAAGELFVSKKCKPQIHLQISQFNPLKTDNTDDLLDLLTYAPKVLEMYGAYVISNEIIASQEINSIPVLAAGANSCF